MQHHNVYWRQWLRAGLRLSTFLGLAMIGLLWAGLVFHLSEEEHDAIQAVRQNTDNLVRVFAGDVDC